jgi:hypothetical protein
MPLSDEEQRALDEIEHALMAEDRRLARRVQRPRLGRGASLVLPAAGLLGGMVLVIIGLVGADAVHVAVAVAGFVVVVASCSWGMIRHHRARIGRVRGSGRRDV